MKTPPHVLDIANSDQCCYCGNCLGVCPGLDDKKNLFIESFDEKEGWKLAIQNEDRCLKCTLCRDACPMDSIDFAKLEQEAFDIRPHEDPLLGVYINCYASYSKDKTYRFNGASGGVISEILRWMFQKQMIDGALVVVPGVKGPTDYQGVIVDTPEQLEPAAKSHYMPIPAMAAIDQVLYGKYRKLAVVGIPCQLNGLRLAQQRMNKLKSRIAIMLGSFCGYTSHFRILEYLKSRASKEGETPISQMRYRTGEWPGNITVDYSNGTSEKISGELRDHVAFAGILPACLYCADHFNELADISCGDAWLEEYLQRKDGGWSVLVTRTQRGQALLDQMLEENLLHLEEIPAADIVKSQRGPMDYKKRGLGARLALRKLFTANTPKIANARLMPWGFMDLIAAVALFIQIRISKKQWFWNILRSSKTNRVRLFYKPMYILQKRYDIGKRIIRKVKQLCNRPSA